MAVQAAALMPAVGLCGGGLAGVGQLGQPGGVLARDQVGERDRETANSFRGSGQGVRAAVGLRGGEALDGALAS